MKKIGLIDVDGKIPNLALMKLSAWHKSQGDTITMLPSKVSALFTTLYDDVYASKVFSWTKLQIPATVKLGGSGSNNKTDLPLHINNLCPDYSLYPMDYSMGFLTRGCKRKCEWCIVPEKEGNVRPEHDIELFLRHNKAVLLDNNVLSHEFGIKQIEKIANLGVKVDFNQGLDARLIDKPIATLLAKVKWLKPIRLACDTSGMIPIIKRAVKLLRDAGATPRAYFCYVLVEDIDSALERVEVLRDLKVDPFAQPYRPPSGGEPDKQLKRFARWVNHKAIFKTVAWENYR